MGFYERKFVKWLCFIPNIINYYNFTWIVVAQWRGSQSCILRNQSSFIFSDHRWQTRCHSSHRTGPTSTTYLKDGWKRMVNGDDWGSVCHLYASDKPVHYWFSILYFLNFTWQKRVTLTKLRRQFPKWV